LRALSPLPHQAAALLEARRRLAWADAYTRMPALLALAELLPPAQWLALLGRHWSICNNIGAFRTRLRRHLPKVGPVTQMMTPLELAAWHQLPAAIEVYRGCGIRNMRGLSWSLDRHEAERFPSLTRYRAAPALLVVGRVLKARVLAVKLDRNEAEIVTDRARTVRVELMPVAGVAAA
jgi:hypothetical protein